MVLEMVYNVLEVLLALLRREFFLRKKKVALMINHYGRFKKIMTQKFDTQNSKWTCANLKAFCHYFCKVKTFGCEVYDETIKYNESERIHCYSYWSLGAAGLGSLREMLVL